MVWRQSGVRKWGGRSEGRRWMLCADFPAWEPGLHECLAPGYSIAACRLAASPICSCEWCIEMVAKPWRTSCVFEAGLTSSWELDQMTTGGPIQPKSFHDSKIKYQILLFSYEVSSLLPMHVDDYVAEKLCHMEFEEATLIKDFLDQRVILISLVWGMQVKLQPEFCGWLEIIWHF